MATRIRLSVLLVALCTAVAACGSGSTTSSDPSDTSQASNEETAQTSAVRVITYNIRYANDNDGENVWENRRDAMAAYLDETGADLIGVQEAEPEQRAWLADHLPDYGWYGVGRNAEHDEGEGTPIFYRRDRFDLLGSGTFWLSTTPDVAGSVGWDAALPRVASWVRLLDKQTGQPLLMVNTHFDHRGPEARLQSAHLLTQQIDALVLSEGARLPVILTGDFNCRTSDPPYLAITEADSPDLRLADAAALSETTPEGGDSTSNGFEAINPGAKIDHVFVKDVRAVLSHRIDDPRIDDRFVSDHLPIVVEVAVR